MDCGLRPPVAAGGDNIADSGQTCGGQSSPACRLRLRGSVVQTNPIRRPQPRGAVSRVQTKPISPAGGRPGGPEYPPFQYAIIPPFQPDAIVPNKANFRAKPGGQGPRGGRRRSSAQNKANLPAGRGTWMLYKQSQFRLRPNLGPIVRNNPIGASRTGRRGRGWSLLCQITP